MDTDLKFIIFCVYGLVSYWCSDIAPEGPLIDTVTFQTRDHVEISATVSVPETGQKNYPAVIFIHQGGSDKSEWTSTELYKNVVSSGMVAMAYDVRGHGLSGGKGGRALFDDVSPWAHRTIMLEQPLPSLGKHRRYLILRAGQRTSQNCLRYSCLHPNRNKAASELNGQRNYTN